MSGNSPQGPSSEDAIRHIRNDPDVYMEIRPSRNSNACASCRKKKKRCELGVNGPNTTCKRCSDFGLECKYETPLGQQSTSPSPTISTSSFSPPTSHPSLPQYIRGNSSVRSDPGVSWSRQGGAGIGRTASQDVLAPFDKSFTLPLHSGDLQPSAARAGTSPLTNTYGVIHQGDIYSDVGMNSLHTSQRPTRPFASAGRTASAATGPQYGALSFDPLLGRSNSFASSAFPQSGWEPMDFAQPTPPVSCGCTLESTCYLHKPPGPTPTDMSDFGWTPGPHF